MDEVWLSLYEAHLSRLILVIFIRFLNAYSLINSGCFWKYSSVCLIKAYHCFKNSVWEGPTFGGVRCSHWDSFQAKFCPENHQAYGGVFSCPKGLLMTQFHGYCLLLGIAFKWVPARHLVQRYIQRNRRLWCVFEVLESFTDIKGRKCLAFLQNWLSQSAF